MQIKTACPLDCWDTCSIIAQVEDGRVNELKGDKSHPVTQGFLCGKGRRLKDRLYDANRILHPMKKEGGAWKQITWEQAYTEISDTLQSVIDEYGHHAVLHAYDWGSGTVLKNLNQRFFYRLGGCTETVGSLCWEAGLEAQRYDFGQARSHAPADTAKADAIVVWGRNVANTNIHMVPFIKQAQAKGATLCVVNPLATDLDDRADLVVAPRPGSDAVLALGVLNYCQERGWIDETFVSQHAVGWDAFLKVLVKYDLETTARETDVSPEAIAALARVYGHTRPTTTLLGLGMQRYPGGGNAIRAIDALAAATGQIGVSGGGVNYANRAIPEFFDQDALTLRAKAKVREFARGTQAEDILTADPPIQMMFVTRTNTVTQVPDTAALLQAYATIPCKVVMDTVMTETAQLADYFLPCTSVLEEEDFVFSTMWHGYVTYIEKAVDPLGEAKPDWQIFAELAHRMGFGDDMQRPLDEWFEIVLRPLQRYGITLADLRAKGTIQLPLDAVPWHDFQFLTPSGKYEFMSETAAMDGHSAHATYLRPHEISSPQEDESGSYPFALLTVHPRLSENSQHRDAPHLPEYPVIEVPSAVASRRGLVDGGLARVWNDRAEVLASVKVKDRGHPFTVKLESGWWGQGITVNHFTRSYQADFGVQTAQYDATVDVEPVTACTSVK